MNTRIFKILWPIYAGYFLMGFNFILPIYNLFLLSRGLNFANIGLLMSVVYLFIFLFEYPTSIFADKYGRKLSLSISFLLGILAMGIEIFAYNLITFIIAAAFIGISGAFLSGTLQAHIYDILKERRLQKHNTKVAGQLIFLATLSGFFASPLGSYLFSLDKTLPFWVLIIANFAAMFFFNLVKEPKYKKHTMTNLESFKAGFKLLLKNKTLFSLTLLSLFVFLFEDAWYITQQPALIALGLPLTMLGLYYSVRLIFTGLGGLILPKIVKSVNKPLLFFISIVLNGLCYFGFAINNLYVVITSAILFLLAYGLWNYLEVEVIHKHIPSHIRATTLSAKSVIMTGLLIFIPWIMGILVNTFNRTTLFVMLGIATMAISLPIFFWRRKYLN